MLNDEAFARAFGGAILVGVGILLFILGVLLLIGGGVWRYTNRKNRQPPPL